MPSDGEEDGCFESRAACGMESGKFTRAESSAWLEAWVRGWGEQEWGGRGMGGWSSVLMTYSLSLGVP